MNKTTLCPQCGTPRPQNGALDGLCPACMLRPNLNLPEPGTGRAGAALAGSSLPKLSDIQRDFPQLKILELVGRGGMGLVYRARQIKLDRFVALKVLLPELANDPTFAERFLREAQALAKLDHPNVVTVYDFGEQSGRYFLMMEFVDGAPLREMMDKGKLNMAKIVQLIPQVCAGLSYAHEQGIVHRDIKPENILLDRYGEAKIADFGLVKLLDRDEQDWRLTRASQVMGTPQYMAPEQMTHPTQVDHRADIYSLGVVLYEMLTGEPPVGRFELPSERVQVDKRFDGIVLKATERKPEDRYQKVREFGDRVALLGQFSTAAIAEAADLEPGFGLDEDLFNMRIPFGNAIDPLFSSSHGHVGHVWAEKDAMVIRWCTKNVWGTPVLPTADLRIPYDALTKIRFRPWWVFWGEFTITGRRFDFAGEFPNVRPGEIRMFVPMGYIPHMRRLSQALGRKLR